MAPPACLCYAAPGRSCESRQKGPGRPPKADVEVTAPTGGSGPTPARLAGIHDELWRQRLEAQAQIAALTDDFDRMVAASVSSNTDDEHDPEGATIAFERAQLVAVLDLARRRLEEIGAALARLTTGTYGSCADCGQQIGLDRLVARPSVTTCIACARRRTG